MVNRFLFGAIAAGIVVLTLLSCKALGGLYLCCAQLLAIEPAWISKHSPEISGFGHLISCFILTCLGFSVFKGNYLRAVFYVAGLAVLDECLQSFSATRQANIEDIVLGFSGILLASTVIFFIKRKSFSASSHYQ